MKRGKYQTSPKGVSSKAVALVLALVLTIGCVVGGTIAWLTDTTTEVKNTFTYGEIDIELAETTGNTYQMVPGNTITKDPVVTVKAVSEDCWLFVKVEKSSNFENYLEYEMAEGWIPLDGVANVFYREVDDTNANQDFAVLKGNKVTVKNTVTNAEMLEIKTANQPTLTFTAYAVQKDNVATAADAWAKLNP